MTLQAFIPEVLVSGFRAWEGAALTVRDGVVAAVGAPLEGAELVRLPGCALLPGLVSAHSHAFQRAIRGRTEYRNHPVDDFWTWREAMYAAVESLTPDEIYAVSKMCFLEMARSGITCVGEFHYLHRDPQGRPYADANELDKQRLASGARGRPAGGPAARGLCARGLSTSREPAAGAASSRAPPGSIWPTSIGWRGPSAAIRW